MIDFDFDIEKQPLITIATQGKVANGKSSLIRALTNVNPMKFKKEAEKNMTIKLGYTNAKFYKCKQCPAPFCYQVNKLICEQCDNSNELILYVSFVDSPGHNDLQTTALSGASNVNYCLLVVSAENEVDIETNEHYKAIKILNLLENSIIIHNKIDLITKEQAKLQYNKLCSIYDIKTIIPMCAQFGFGINYLIENLIKKIKNPINKEFLEKIKQPLKISIIRSFDINKPGTLVENMKGAVVGGTIKNGCLKIGTKVKIIPGIILGDGNIKKLEAYVTSLKTENTDLDIAYPGGLIGIGLSIDPTLSKEDRLIGNFIVDFDYDYKTFKKVTINFKKYNENLSIDVNEKYLCMIYSQKRNIKIININYDKNILSFTSNIEMYGEIDDPIIITKNNNIQLYGNIIEIDY